MNSVNNVSVVLIAYNQERFIRESVQSILAQTFNPLEIILSDDCSSDQTFSIMREEAEKYRGSKKIILNRNLQNLGLAGNLNRAFELSSGQFIVVQAGDDISLPDRVEKLFHRWRIQSPPVDLVCSYFEEIDVDGKSTGYIKKEVMFVPDLTKDPVSWRCGATGACASYSRKLIDKYGPLNRHVLSEDWVYSFRAWVESGIAVIEEPLVKHRTHGTSISVINRDISAERNPEKRIQQRRKNAEGALAIAKEWHHAWIVSEMGKKKMGIEPALQKLIVVRDLQLRAFESSRLEAIKLSLMMLINGGEWIYAAKLFVRHVIRWV